MLDDAFLKVIVHGRPRLIFSEAHSQGQAIDVAQCMKNRFAESQRLEAQKTHPPEPYLAIKETQKSSIAATEGSMARGDEAIRPLWTCMPGRGPRPSHQPKKSDWSPSTHKGRKPHPSTDTSTNGAYSRHTPNDGRPVWLHLATLI